MIGREYTPQIYFSDVFQVKAETVDEYGAFDVALVNDLPLFVDPFLLFNMEHLISHNTNCVSSTSWNVQQMFSRSLNINLRTYNGYSALNVV